MSNSLKSIEDGWKSLKAGTFVDDYTKEIRTALQRAIDQNNPSVRVERKKNIDEGDLQMNDGSGWEQFCIHQAHHLINKKCKYVAIREFIKGQWINYDRDRNDLFQNSLKDKEQSIVVTHPRFVPMDRSDWYKMADQDRSLSREEGDYGISNRRRFV